MRSGDLGSLALGALSANRRRTLLSLLGVAIGVTAVLLLTALGDGARTYVREQFAALGANTIAVLPGKSETSGALPGFGGTPNDLTLADAEALRRGIPSLRDLAPVSLANEVVAHGERNRQVIVMGSTASMLGLRDISVRVGRFLPKAPWTRGAPIVVIGSTLAEELFPGENPVGQVVRLGSWRMRVLGVLEHQGTHMGVDMDETVFVPVATGLKMFDQSSLFRILMGVRTAADIPGAKARTAAILRERHGEEDFTLITQDAVLGALGSILGMLTLALVSIAAISLTVAGIGIMNVMLVSVSERTEEVGLLKAIGAVPRQVLALFLAEAVLLSLAGGLFGLGLGAVCVRVLRVVWPAFPAATPPWAIAAALGVSLVVGAVFGVVPARRAMRLEPVAALTGRSA